MIIIKIYIIIIVFIITIMKTNKNLWKDELSNKTNKYSISKVKDSTNKMRVWGMGVGGGGIRALLVQQALKSFFKFLSVKCVKTS